MRATRATIVSATGGSQVQPPLTLGEHVRRVILGILVPVTTALGACAGKVGDAAQVSQETCGYDQRTLMPAIEAAIPSDATARMTMEMSGAGMDAAFDAVIAYTPTGAEMEVRSRTPGDEFALVFVDDRFFVSDSPAGSTYQEIDSSDPAAAQLRNQVAGMDLTSTFAAWNAGLEKVEQVGEEEIDRERVCHYSLTVNTAEAAAAKGESLPRGMPETLDYELFLTMDDLMRRIRFDVSGIKAEMNASHWNDPVDIKVPPGH